MPTRSDRSLSSYLVAIVVELVLKLNVPSTSIKSELTCSILANLFSLLASSKVIKRDPSTLSTLLDNTSSKLIT
jgi:hypothetical protein